MYFIGCLPYIKGWGKFCNMKLFNKDRFHEHNIDVAVVKVICYLFVRFYITPLIWNSYFNHCWMGCIRLGRKSSDRSSILFNFHISCWESCTWLYTEVIPIHSKKKILIRSLLTGVLALGDFMMSFLCACVMIGTFLSGLRT